MSGQAFIGIDLGGTNVRAGAVTPEGQLLLWRDVPIEARQGPEIGVRRITALIDQVCSEAGIRPQAIGIGSTGPLDRQRGAIQNPYTLPTWEDVDIASPLSKKFGVLVTLENDADAAALGESWQGAGRGKKSLAMVTVGTGIGTAFIQDGDIFRGINGTHPEGGHIPVDPSGPECYCGARGCWESLASGTAIGVLARRLVTLEHSSLLAKADNDPAQIDAALVAAAAREGDTLSMRIIDQAATYLGLGLVSILHLFLPDCVIFSGGVFHSAELFLPRLAEIISRHSIMSPLDQIPLYMAELGQQSGILGAAKAAILATEK
ncbi:MAG TPA: ROK family protein [Anaerolineales bacterium]|jgi:glucokinase